MKNTSKKKKIKGKIPVHYRLYPNTAGIDKEKEKAALQHLIGKQQAIELEWLKKIWVFRASCKMSWSGFLRDFFAS